MTTETIVKILDRASSLRIAVIGDKILDRYIFGDINKISPEAPVPILRLTGTRENPGGAGNVVENLRGLGCQVSAFYGDHVPVKTRVMSGNHHVIRIDEEEEPKWMRWDDIGLGLGYGIEYKKFDAVVISDYGKGCVSEDVAKSVIELCDRFGIPVVVDSKYNLDYFEGATLVKCNLKEWNPDMYIKKNMVDNLVITLGEHGMRYWGSETGSTPGLKVEICDVCGAGDTVISVLGVAMALKMPLSSACELANIAASEVCRWPGVKPIDKELLLKRFNEVYDIHTTNKPT